jgi:FAD/FMN-containing dehydrogenase
MTTPSEFIHELQKHFTGEIHTDTASRILYSTDASIYQIEPIGVLLPRTQEDLIAAVELAAKYQIPVLPRGAGQVWRRRRLVKPNNWIVRAGWTTLSRLMPSLKPPP